MQLTKEVAVGDNYLLTASEKIEGLKTRTESLKKELEEMYELLTTALDTPAGHQLELTAKDVILQPVDDLAAVFKYVSGLLDEITTAQYYKKVFNEYDTLNQSVKKM